MKTNPSTPSPKHDQSQEPIFPCRSCKACQYYDRVEYWDGKPLERPYDYCGVLFHALSTTSIGCGYWKQKPKNTPSPEHDQNQEPIFPDCSCKSCASGVGILYPSTHGRWEPRIYCHLLGRACKITLVGCSYWQEKPPHGH